VEHAEQGKESSQATDKARSIAIGHSITGLLPSVFLFTSPSPLFFFFSFFLFTPQLASFPAPPCYPYVSLVATKKKEKLVCIPCSPWVLGADHRNQQTTLQHTQADCSLS